MGVQGGNPLPLGKNSAGKNKNSPKNILISPTNSPKI